MKIKYTCLYCQKVFMDKEKAERKYCSVLCFCLDNTPEQRLDRDTNDAIDAILNQRKK